MLKLLILLSLAYQEPAPDSAKVAPAPEISFEGVVDDQPVEYEDQAAYYGLLDLAAHADQRTLRRQAEEVIATQHQAGKFKTLPPEKYPLFYEMLTRPEAFRGKPVLLKGHILQVDTYEAGDNPYGIKNLYECWLITEDSQNHPCTVIFTEKPDRLQLGKDLRDNVEVTGYFLKVYTYPALDHRNRKAPLIMARTVVLHDPPRMEMRSVKLIVWMAVGAIIGGITLLALLTLRSIQRMKNLRKALLTEPAPDFSHFQNEDPQPKE